MSELAEAIGDDAARNLARRFGGTSIYVPRAIGDHHPICAVIGREAADRLVRWAGSTSVSIPKQPERRRRVMDLRAQSWTVQQIAIETSYSERHVYRLLSENEGCQADLFGDT